MTPLAVLAAAVALTSPPPPDAPLPAGPAGYAHALVRAKRELTAAVERWSKRGAAPQALQLHALYQQRLYLALGDDPRLAGRVLGRLTSAVRAEALDIVAARRALTVLTRPVRTTATFRVGPARPAAELLAYYREAERRFAVDWEVLAAVNFVESAFGRVRSPSTAGAQGPMQFLPSTWQRYGLGGDVHDPHDAILGAANYLRASGYTRDARRALYAYNRSDFYVLAILRYAARMRADANAYYVFHEWQVFVRTASGRLRLTGPGVGSGA
jgi:membrane-bound lytic murein transglycosylase B